MGPALMDDGALVVLDDLSDIEVVDVSCWHLTRGGLSVRTDTGRRRRVSVTAMVTEVAGEERRNPREAWWS